MEYLSTKLPGNYKHGIRLLAAARGQSMESLASEMIMKMFHDAEYFPTYSLAFKQYQEEKKREEISRLKAQADLAIAKYLDAIEK